MTVLYLVEFLFCPANVPPSKAHEAEMLGLKIAEKMGIVGLLAIEMFITKDGFIFGGIFVFIGYIWIKEGLKKRKELSSKK